MSVEASRDSSNPCGGGGASRRDFLQRLLGLGSVALGAGGAFWLAQGDASEVDGCLRPPGAMSEEDFLSTCIRCGRCADACPNRSIVAFTASSGAAHAMKPGPGQVNTPVIFPRAQACILCNGAPGEELLCTAACPTGALTRTSKDVDTIRTEVAMGTAEVDTSLCYSFNGSSCGVCVRACPLEGTALRAGLWEKPLVSEEDCVGCGLCERACIRYPQAIRVIPKNAAKRG